MKIQMIKTTLEKKTVAGQTEPDLTYYKAAIIKAMWFGIRMAKIKKTDRSTCWQGRGGTGSLYTTGGNTACGEHIEEQFGSFLEC